MNNKLYIPIPISNREVEGGPDDEYRFAGDISDTAVDAYDSRMSSSTIDNFVKDCGNRVQLLDSHASDLNRVLGYSVSAQRSGDVASGVFAMLRDVETTPAELQNNEHIRRIEKGLYSGLSVGFYGGREICDICSRGVWEWSEDGDNCSHWPGREYDGVRMTYTIDNARLAEVSIVASPANPNAQITERASRAESVIREYKESPKGLPKQEYTEAEQRWIAAGKAYSEQLIGEALRAGVRAKGVDFDSDKWKARLEVMDVDAIREHTEMWTALGDSQWNGGRITRDTDSPVDGENPRIYPTWLYQ